MYRKKLNKIKIKNYLKKYKMKQEYFLNNLNLYIQQICIGYIVFRE